MASLRKCSAHHDTREFSEEESTLSGFRALSDMLQSLTNNNGDGRIIVSRSQSTCSGQKGGYIKYVMLTGEKIFSEVLQKLLILTCMDYALLRFIAPILIISSELPADCGPSTCCSTGRRNSATYRRNKGAPLPMATTKSVAFLYV